MKGNEFITLKRKQYGMTQRELSEKSGISPAELSKIESGVRRKISINTIKKLDSILHFSFAEINILYGLSDTIDVGHENNVTKLYNILSKKDVEMILSLKKDDLIKLKNYICFLTNDSVLEKDKDAISVLIKTISSTKK